MRESGPATEARASRMALESKRGTGSANCCRPQFSIDRSQRVPAVRPHRGRTVSVNELVRGIGNALSRELARFENGDGESAHAGADATITLAKFAGSARPPPLSARRRELRDLVCQLP